MLGKFLDKLYEQTQYTGNDGFGYNDANYGVSVNNARTESREASLYPALYEYYMDKRKEFQEYTGYSYDTIISAMASSGIRDIRKLRAYLNKQNKEIKKSIRNERRELREEEQFIDRGELEARKEIRAINKKASNEYNAMLEERRRKRAREIEDSTSWLADYMDDDDYILDEPKEEIIELSEEEKTLNKLYENFRVVENSDTEKIFIKRNLGLFKRSKLKSIEELEEYFKTELYTRQAIIGVVALDVLGTDLEEWRKNLLITFIESLDNMSWLKKYPERFEQVFEKFSINAPATMCSWYMGIYSANGHGILNNLAFHGVDSLFDKFNVAFKFNEEYILEVFKLYDDCRTDYKCRKTYQILESRALGCESNALKNLKFTPEEKANIDKFREVWVTTSSSGMTSVNYDTALRVLRLMQKYSDLDWFNGNPFDEKYKNILGIAYGVYLIHKENNAGGEVSAQDVVIMTLLNPSIDIQIATNEYIVKMLSSALRKMGIYRMEDDTIATQECLDTLVPELIMFKYRNEYNKASASLKSSMTFYRLVEFIGKYCITDINKLISMKAISGAGWNDRFKGYRPIEIIRRNGVARLETIVAEYMTITGLQKYGEPLNMRKIKINSIMEYGKLDTALKIDTYLEKAGMNVDKVVEYVRSKAGNALATEFKGGKLSISQRGNMIEHLKNLNINIGKDLSRMVDCTYCWYCACRKWGIG